MKKENLEPYMTDEEIIERWNKSEKTVKDINRSKTL